MVGEAPDAGRGEAGADSQFPRARRLRRRAEFREVFDHGRSRSDRRLIVYAMPRETPGLGRLGLAIGRKYGSSPERNRWKRLVREAFRTRSADLPDNHDLVVLPAAPVSRAAFEEIATSLVNTARSAARMYLERGPRKRRRL